MRSSKLLVSVLGVVALAVGLAAFGAPDGRAQRDDVTLRLDRFYDDVTRSYKLRFSGTIPSGAANEYVAVLQQKCGSASSIAIAGASTRAGGVWQAEPVDGVRLESDSATYRARWKGWESDPVVFRSKLQLWLTKLGGGRYRVRVDTQQHMKGRPVELQRFVAGQWTRVRSAGLARFRGDYSATFTVQRRGLNLRVLVPARSAAPCHSATASETFVSGAASGARVIDRTLLCSIAMRGGIRLLEIRASARTASGDANFGATTNWRPDGTLVSATTESLSLNPTRCTQAGARVPLTTATLEGGPAGLSEREFECETPSRVLVRVRAVFRSPAAFETASPFGYPVLSASGEVKEASLAVRTQTGRPLAFASVHESGRARVFGGRGCNEDTT